MNRLLSCWRCAFGASRPSGTGHLPASRRRADLRACVPRLARFAAAVFGAGAARLVGHIGHRRD